MERIHQLLRALEQTRPLSCHRLRPGVVGAEKLPASLWHYRALPDYSDCPDPWVTVGLLGAKWPDPSLADALAAIGAKASWYEGLGSGEA